MLSGFIRPMWRAGNQSPIEVNVDQEDIVVRTKRTIRLKTPGSKNVTNKQTKRNEKSKNN